MKSQKIILFIAGGVLLVGLILAGLYGRDFSPTVPGKTLVLPERNDTVPAVPVLFDYGTKIVYSTDVTVDKSLYIDDCSTRGGVFNACGNACAPTADTCATSCALICTLKP